MVGLAAVLGLITAGGFLGGAGYSAQAMMFAPVTDLLRGYNWAYGMGLGMVPGLYRNAAIQEELDAKQRVDDRLYQLQDKIFDWVLDYKLAQYDRQTAVPKTRYRLVY